MPWYWPISSLLLEIILFSFLDYPGRGQVGPLVKAPYRLHYGSNSASFFLEKRDPAVSLGDPIVSMVKETTLRSSGINVSENIKHWYVEMSSYHLVCQDCGRGCQVCNGVLVGVPPKVDLRARRVQLECQAISYILGIFHIRRNLDSLVNSKTQGWRRQKSRSQC